MSWDHKLKYIRLYFVNLQTPNHKMIKEKDIKYIWNMVLGVEVQTLQTYKDILSMSQILRDYKESSPYKPPFAINYLEYYDCQERVTSWIIRHIFAYSFDGWHPFLVSFVKTFLQETGFQVEWIETPIIDTDHEYKGMDILIRDKKYAIIIENKLKGAQFQLNQLARYIALMRQEGYPDEQIFVVIFPKENISNDKIKDSVWKLPPDWQSTSLSRKCRVDSYTCRCDYEDYQKTEICGKCESLRDIFEGRVVFVHSELSKWLYHCIVKETTIISKEELIKQYVLTSAVLQFVDFLNYLYKTRESDKYKMSILKFISEQLQLEQLDIVSQLSVVEDKKKNAENLVSQLNELYWEKIYEYIVNIRKKYHDHIPRFKCKNDKYLTCELNFNGILIKIAVDYDEDEKKDYCEISTEQEGGIPVAIKNDFDVSEELNDVGNRNDCIWRYDSYKESLLRFDRILGRLLELKKGTASIK